VISRAGSGHDGVMGHPGLRLEERLFGPGERVVPTPEADTRLRALVDAHHDFVWRSLRRLGVPPGDVDDGAQRVFLTVSRKLASIRESSERSFLFQTALRVAADARRSRMRRREVAHDEEAVDDAPGGEELLDLRRARKRLDAILDGMSMDLRAVFVLFELDEMTMAEIATLLGLPAGTVASRLRRARSEFRDKAARVASGRVRRGGGT
jgi:RNA polymerase sigma-70 factor (ECF subfamily)